MASLAPQATITDAERTRGLRLLVVEAAFSGGASALTTGVVLSALALHLGASNVMIGVLASAPFLAQLLQLPAVLLVERLRMRKRIAVLTSIVGRLMLGVMAATAFFPGSGALAVFLAAQLFLCGMGAIGSCAWNSWLRDLAPESQLGRVFARRTAWLTLVGLVMGIAAALALAWTGEGSRARDLVFAGMLGAGCVTGLASARLVAGMPEPQMPAAAERVRLWPLVSGPLRDPNYRRLLRFVASWQFAVNFATPFFTVFIVRQLGFDVGFVMLLNVVSQVANLLAIRSWGALSDRYANKSVLAVCAPVYIASIVGMIGASQLDRGWAAAWLTVLHLFMGAAIAGVTLTSTNIAMKLSPQGRATAYVAANAMVTALAAGIAPILGGLLADFFAARRLELSLHWTSPNGSLGLPIVLTQWNFYFLIAGLIGLYAMHRLSLVAERGEVERREMVGEVLMQARRQIRNVSSVAGLRAATELPASLIRDARARRQARRRRQHGQAGARP